MAVSVRPHNLHRFTALRQRVDGAKVHGNNVRNVRLQRMSDLTPSQNTHDDGWSRAFVIGILLMALALLLVAVFTSLVPNASLTSINILLGMLGLGTVSLAWVFALSCALRRSLFQDPRAAFLGVGIVLIGGIVPTTDLLALPFLRQEVQMPTGIEALGAAALMIGFLVLTFATFIPEWISRFEGWSVIAGSAILLAVLWMILDLLPVIVRNISVLTPSPTAFAHNLVPALVIGAAGLFLGITQVIQGARSNGSLNVWLGNTLLAWALSYLFVPLWGIDETWAAATGVFGLLAMLFAIVGIDFELELSFEGIAHELFNSLVSTRLLSANRELEIGFSRKRVHDMHNILFSVEGAATLLQKPSSLSDDQRKAVSKILRSQLAYLQKLIETPLLEVGATLESVWNCARTGIDLLKFQIPTCAPDELCDVTLAGSTEDNCRAIRLVLDHLTDLSNTRSIEVEFGAESGYISIKIAATFESQGETEIGTYPGGDTLELYASDLLLRRSGGTATQRVYQGIKEIHLLLPVANDANVLDGVVPKIAEPGPTELGAVSMTPQTVVDTVQQSSEAETTAQATTARPGKCS